MASYDPYPRDPPRRQVREDRRDDRDPRYLDARDYARPLHSRDLVPRTREDSDLSVEEIRRDFPPPTGRNIRRARSADHERYYRESYDYRHDPRYEPSLGHRHDRGSRRAGPYYYEEDERRHKRKSMTKQDKIFAAVAGAALLAGGKEIYDRYEAKQDGVEVQRNPLSSVALAGFGALAGYQGAEFYSKQQAKKDQTAHYILHRGRDEPLSDYHHYSDNDDYDDDDDDPRNKRGHRNFLENALAATGLGAAVKTLTAGGGGHRDRPSDDVRSRGGSPARSRAGSTHSRSAGAAANKIQKAAMASLLAGATEAFRVAKEPGGWKGEKAKRILTAAVGAATVDAAQGENHGKLGLAESVIGGLVGNRLINGSKRDIEEDRATGRSRSRSRARSHAGGGGGGGGGGSGLATLATAGLGALGAKAALDRRPRSRSRASSGSRSYDSRDEYPDRRRRSRSVVDKARSGLAKLGIGGTGGTDGTVAAANDHRRRDQDDFDDRASPRPSPRYSDDYDEDPRYAGGSRARAADYEYERSNRGDGRRDSPRRRGGSSRGYGSESDLGDSEEEKRKARKMKGKQIVTAGLATVATIHAAHGIYQSMEKRNARQRAVRQGRLSAAEAKKLKTTAMIKDAASVGIAALGIKGALEEMKEVKETTHECHVFQEERAKRHEKREQRRRKSQQPGGGQHQRSSSWAPSRHRDGGDHDGVHYGPWYRDDNPYGCSNLPAPPMGHDR
ncbi:uncharacterized protein UV8b_01248 [Ustilaginoidea virens]|uniref:DUF3824 domain-containing protein n=1 Tax=Ustilaginoidea virens TaxID=1159556 RepID=A0A8E5HKK6_USTVR|nr:uncharacterized protein UV8b_01248 [Ustilaginoidea virens]QUC17007.1 hypothetical protein UV8b_01248 [Ustilaginoidea virens]